MATTSEGHQVKKQNSIIYNPAFQLVGGLRSLDKALPPGLCAAIRREIASHRATVRGAVKSIRRLTAEPWTAVSNY